MWIFKKGSKNYPLSLLGDNNLVEALQNHTTPQFSFPVSKDKEGNYVYVNF